jgi:hypothetical protein
MTLQTDIFTQAIWHFLAVFGLFQLCFWFVVGMYFYHDHKKERETMDRMNAEDLQSWNR